MEARTELAASQPLRDPKLEPTTHNACYYRTMLHLHMSSRLVSMPRGKLMLA